jgi:hypothetical protein
MFKLDPKAQEEYDRARAMDLSTQQTFASMTDESLVASAKFWMAHCATPKKYVPDEPIYDATMWHFILPELIRRLER